MTLSGRLTAAQQLSIRLKPFAGLVFIGGVGVAIFLPVVRSSPGLDPTLRFAALAFGPLTGLMAFALAWWFNRDCIVEFGCDDTSFRFRKLGRGEPEVKGISEIVKVEAMGRGRTTGYCVGFKDGEEAVISLRMLPDGPRLGDWFQDHLRRTTAEAAPAPAWHSDRDWRPPHELRWPAPRRVQITTGGLALCLITIAIVVCGDEGMLSYDRDVKTRAAAVQERIRNSREADGVVTSHWSVGLRHTDYFVSYRYSAEGTEWNAAMIRMTWWQWRRLDVGSPISIVYTPGDPANSFPKNNPPYVPPSWLAWAIIPILTAFGILPFAAVLRARRYLVYGKPAPARVLPANWRPGKAATVNYRFPLGDGRTCDGSFVTTNVPPPDHSVIPILYDPDNPRHSTRYPVSLVKIADA